MKAMTIFVIGISLLLIGQVPAFCEDKEFEISESDENRFKERLREYLAIPEWYSFSVAVEYNIDKDTPENMKNRIISKINGALRSLGDVEAFPFLPSESSFSPCNHKLIVGVIHLDETPIYTFMTILLRRPNIFYSQRWEASSLLVEDGLHISEKISLLDKIFEKHHGQYQFVNYSVASLHEERIANEVENIIASYDLNYFQDIRNAHKRSEPEQE